MPFCFYYNYWFFSLCYRRIIRELAKTKVTAVTASTGMASLQLGMNATTLHHWAGISDGRYSHECLQDLIDTDDRFADAKARILKTDCLIIDEISMLSSRTFDMVEFVCRYIKRNNSIFGGLQVYYPSPPPPFPQQQFRRKGLWFLWLIVQSITYTHSQCFSSAHLCKFIY